MIRNYLTLAWRNLSKNSAYSIIVISGLVLAYSACLAIFLFVQSETSYDRQSPDADRMHRIVHNIIDDDGTVIVDATTPPAFAPALRNDVTSIESVVRILPTWGVKALVKAGDKQFYEQRIVGTDSNMVKFFGLKVIAGNPTIHNQKEIVITESTAKKYFGNENPINKTMSINGIENDVTIVAVIADFPSNMHFHFDIACQMWQPANDEEKWTSYNYYTYIKLVPGAKIADVNQQIVTSFETHRPGSTNEFFTQPITDIHLQSKMKWELEANGDQAFVTMFITIGVFIFLIAAVNYINLSIVQALNRSKEVGIRKVSGAQGRELVNQFLLEAMLISVVSMIIAILIMQVATPVINIIFDQHLVPLFNLPFYNVVLVIIFSIAAGLLSGFYPAVYLSAFKPVSVLKGVFQPGSKNLWLRKSLVVLQFAISIALITGAILVFRQVDYLRSKELGFNKDQVIIVPNISQLTNKATLKETLLQVNGVEAVGGSSGILGGQNSAFDLSAKGIDIQTRINYTLVDKDFPNVAGMQIISGRTFSDTDNKDVKLSKVILNEKAINDMGLDIENAIGALVTENRHADSVVYHEVIGVVKDFHYASLRTEIMPYAFFLDNRYFNNFAISINTTDYDRLFEDLKQAWTSACAPGPFEYFFLDEQFARLYRAEENFQAIFFVLTIISVYIACSGLFAVASYFIKRRTKEIGIRKALGASVSQVTWLVSSGFLKMVIIANLLAWPATWMFMNDWLNGFAYRIDMSWMIFAAASVVALVIAVATIAGQSLKAAQANPIRSLRNE